MKLPSLQVPEFLSAKYCDVQQQEATNKPKHLKVK